MSTDSIKVLVAASDGIVISEYLLGEGVYAIGSAAGSNIPVEAAAPGHARLSVQDGKMFIEDLAIHGAGGIYLDGAAVLGRLRVYSGQTIQVADRWLALPALWILAVPYAPRRRADATDMTQCQLDRVRMLTWCENSLLCI